VTEWCLQIVIVSTMLRILPEKRIAIDITSVLWLITLWICRSIVACTIWRKYEPGSYSALALLVHVNRLLGYDCSLIYVLSSCSHVIPLISIAESVSSILQLGEMLKLTFHISQFSTFLRCSTSYDALYFGNWWFRCVFRVAL